MIKVKRFFTLDSTLKYIKELEKNSAIYCFEHTFYGYRIEITVCNHAYVKIENIHPVTLEPISGYCRFCCVPVKRGWVSE